MKSGIYLIKNLKNKKIYVGSAINLKSRFSSHLSSLRKNKHENSHLQRAFNKYGEDAFIFEVLEYCKKEKLIGKEQFYIDKFDVINKGYNICPKAGNSLGFKHSEESKKIMSNKNKGRRFSKETEFKKGHKLFKGKKHTEKTKEKMRKAKLGHKGYWNNKEFSKEHKHNLSIAAKERWAKVRENGIA